MHSVCVSALAFVAVLGFSSLSVDANARSSGVSGKRFSESAWQIFVETDRFSGARRCRLSLRKGKAVYGDGAIVFHLNRHINVSEATVKIDGDTALRWRDLIPDLAGGIGDPLLVSSSKHIPIPSHLIEGAREVAIAPAFGKRPRIFDVTGFDAALRSMVEAGCTPDDAFIGR